MSGHLTVGGKISFMGERGVKKSLCCRIKRIILRNIVVNFFFYNAESDMFVFFRFQIF